MFLRAARFIANSNQSKTFCVSFHKGIAFTANFDSKLASEMGFPSPDDFFESGNKHFDIKLIRFWDPHCYLKKIYSFSKEIYSSGHGAYSFRKGAYSFSKGAYSFGKGAYSFSKKAY